MSKFLKHLVLGVVFVFTSSAHAQLFNYVKVFYIYTSNSTTGDQNLYSINVSKDIVDGKNLEFITHSKNTNEEFDITLYKLDILQCSGDKCTIRASVFSPKLGSVSSHKIYSRRAHKEFDITVEDSLGSVMTVMSATGWKKYAERHQITLPMWENAVNPEECVYMEYCYKIK